MSGCFLRICIKRRIPWSRRAGGRDLNSEHVIGEYNQPKIKTLSNGGLSVENFCSKLKELSRSTSSGARVGVVALLLALILGSLTLLAGFVPQSGFAVYLFDYYGNFHALFAPFGTGPGQIESFGVAVDRNNNILVVDQAHSVVVVFDPFGNRKYQFGAGHLVQPVEPAITSTGQILVADNGGFAGNGFVARFDSAGNFLGQFQLNTIWCPAGLALRANGNILVTDTCNEQVVEFDSLGHLRSLFGSGFLHCPVDLAVRFNGDVYVANGCNNGNGIQVFDQFGNPRFSFGPQGFGPGQLDGPDDVDFMPNGNIAVVDTNNLRIEEFDPYGNYLGMFGNTPGPGKLGFPTALAFQTNSIVVTNEPFTLNCECVNTNAPGGAATPAPRVQAILHK